MVKQTQTLISFSSNSTYTITNNNLTLDSSNKFKSFQIVLGKKTQIFPCKNFKMLLSIILFKITKFNLGILMNRYNRYLQAFKMIFNYLKVYKNWLIEPIMSQKDNNIIEKVQSSRFHRLSSMEYKINSIQAKSSINKNMTIIYSIYKISNKI